MLSIRVVGGVEARVDGDPVDLASAGRARALLAWLALHPGAHGRGELAGRLRPDASQDSARKSLRQAVWSLRGALGEGGAAALVADRDRVGLTDDPSLVSVDLWRAREHRARGELEAAARLAGAGDLVAGLDEEWVHEARALHRQDLRGLLAELADAAADAGDLPAAIAWARRRVAEDPHGEIAVRRLADLLTRAGDRAGALDAIDALRERLRRDLGIAPSAETRELAARVRAGGAITAAAGSSPTPLPGPLAQEGRFVGRAEALARLQAAWRDAAGGALRIACVAGEPGIGKTRIAAELAAQVHAGGATVLYGRCDEEALVPHQPFVEALERHLRDLSPAEGEALAGPHREGLSRVLPAVEPADATGGGDGETARYRAFEAVRGLVEAVAARRPTLLVLDDLHWADRASLHLLRHLIRMTEGGRLLVLGTYRDTEVARDHPLAAALSDLRREHPLVSLPLTGLAADEVAELVGPRGTTPEAIAELGRRANGNPLLLGELAHQLDDGEADDALGVPERVIELVGRRVDRLGDDVADALATAALLGAEFPVDLLEEIHGPGALEALERAAAAGLVAEADPESGRHAFGHALVAEALVHRLSPPLRRRRHRRIAEAVVPRAERDPAAHAAEAARHLQAALPDGDREQAIHWSAAAARRAGTMLADGEAAEHLRRAIAILPAGDPRRGAMLADLGDSADRAGDRGGARAAFDEAGRLARDAGDAALQARAALAAGGLGVVIGPHDPALASALEDAIAAVGRDDPVLRARLLGRLAIELYYADRPRAGDLSADAVAEARRTGDPGALAAALNARRVAIWDIDHADERLAVATEMVEVAGVAGEPATVLQGRGWRVVDLMELGRMDEARREIELHGAEADALGLPHHRWWASLWRGALALMAGDRATAARLGAEALALGRRADDPNARLHVLIQEVQALIDVGRFDGFDRAFVERGAAESPAAWAWKAWLAWVEAETGQRGRAEALVDELARDDFAAVTLDANWHAVADLAEAMAALGPHQAARARRLAERLAPYAGRIAVVGRAAACYGPIDYHLGRLATAAGDPEAAASHHTRALEICERIGAVPRSAQARARLEEARAAIGR